MGSENRCEDREDSRAVEDIEDIEDNANAVTCSFRLNIADHEYEDRTLTQHRNIHILRHGM